MEGKVKLDVTYQYDIFTHMKTDLLFSVPFNNLKTIKVEPKIKKEGILTTIDNFSGRHGKDLADQLASYGGKLSKLLDVPIIDQLGPEMAGALICCGARN